MQEKRKIIALGFDPGISGQPVMCHLAREHNLTFNILQARISPRQEGRMIVEIWGKPSDFAEGIAYLRSRSIAVTSVDQNISRDEETCIHCGMCTAMCPTGALHINPADRTIAFDGSRCSACGACTRVCPVQAMHLQALLTE